MVLKIAADCNFPAKKATGLAGAWKNMNGRMSVPRGSSVMFCGEAGLECGGSTPLSPCHSHLPLEKLY